jgi:drug/metabolite transporter (DMT)-like permease
MKNTIVHIAAITSMFFWGLTYVWSKFVFETYTPLTTITLRLLGSFIVLYLFIYITNRNEKIKAKDRKLIILSAFFNPFFYFLGEYYGLSMVSASISALIVSTIPIFTPFVARKFFNEKLSIFNVIGLIVSFAGVLIIVLKRDFSLNASGLGITLLFLAVFSAVIYSVMVKKLTDSYSPITIIANQNLIGTLLFLPMFLYFDFSSFIEIKPSFLTLVSLFMLSVFGSSICYVLYAFVIKRIELSKANIYTNLIPIFAAIASYFFLDEYFNSIKIIGMLIVIIGIILSQVKFSRK